jgi:hypothetical protein
MLRARNQGIVGMPLIIARWAFVQIVDAHDLCNFLERGSKRWRRIIHINYGWP